MRSWKFGVPLWTWSSPSIDRRSNFQNEEVYGLRASVAAPQFRSLATSRKAKDDSQTKSSYISCSTHAGPLFEIETQIQLAERLGYVAHDESKQLQRETVRVGQMLRSVRPAA